MKAKFEIGLQIVIVRLKWRKIKKTVFFSFNWMNNHKNFKDIALLNVLDILLYFLFLYQL